MARNIVLQTPAGVIIQTKTKGGSVKAVLEWNSGFGGKYSNNFSKAQKFVDSEVLRYCSARVPFDTGMLQKSGILGTIIGSGVVRWIAPYAWFQYYGTSRGIVGRPWFEEIKAAHGAQIRSGAARIAGGR